MPIKLYGVKIIFLHKCHKNANVKDIKISILCSCENGSYKIRHKAGCHLRMCPHWRMYQNAIGIKYSPIHSCVHLFFLETFMLRQTQ